MKLTKKTPLPHRTKLQPGIYLREKNLPHILIEKNLQIDKQNVFTMQEKTREGKKSGPDEKPSPSFPLKVK